LYHTDIEAKRNTLKISMHTVLQGRSRTHHLILAQRASSMPISAKICIFPAVMNASAVNTARRDANAPSTMSKKVGFKDEPGLRMVEKKDSSLSGDGDDGVEVDMMEE